MASAYAIYANEGNPNIAWAIPLFVATLFICCMVCHGELARLKPDPRHLTSFYMMISLGGTLGGVFVAIIAPHVFHTYFELPLSMVACSALAAIVLWISPHKWQGKIRVAPVRIAMLAFTVGLAIHLGYEKHLSDQRFRLSVRNFYGVLRVRDIPEDEQNTAVRRLIHGTINHGTQLLDAALSRRTHQLLRPLLRHGPRAWVTCRSAAPSAWPSSDWAPGSPPVSAAPATCFAFTKSIRWRFPSPAPGSRFSAIARPTIRCCWATRASRWKRSPASNSI